MALPSIKTLSAVFSEPKKAREIYMRAVLRLNLPTTAALMRAMRRYFGPEFLAKYPQTVHSEYKQRH